MRVRRVSAWVPGLFAGVLMTSVWVAAAGPGEPTTLFPYAGYLEENGTPVNALVDLQFELFTVESGGAPVWTEEHAAEPVMAGRFSVALGRNDALSRDLTQNNGLYLQIGVKPMDSVDPYAVLPERQRLLSVPYATRGDRADEADHADSADTALLADELIPQTNIDFVGDGTVISGIRTNGGIGNGIRMAIGAGGMTLIGAGEATDSLLTRGRVAGPGVENLILAADDAVEIWSGTQSDRTTPTIRIASNQTIAIRGDTTFLNPAVFNSALRVPVSGALNTGGNETPEVYLGAANSCSTIGRIRIFKPDSQANQDSLCYCGNIDDVIRWVCFNP